MKFNPFSWLRRRVQEANAWAVAPLLDGAEHLTPEEFKAVCADKARHIYNFIDGCTSTGQCDYALAHIQVHFEQFNMPNIRQELQLKVWEKRKQIEQHQQDLKIAKRPYKVFKFIDEAVTCIQFERAERIIELNFQILEDEELTKCMSEHLAERKQALKVSERNRIQPHIV